jgi:hypothetical protein
MFENHIYFIYFVILQKLPMAYAVQRRRWLSPHGNKDRNRSRKWLYGMKARIPNNPHPR